MQHTKAAYMQHATYKRGMQRTNATSPCNVQHTTCKRNLQHMNTACNAQTQHATCDIQHATYKRVQMHHAICKRNMQHMNNMRRINATCNMQHTNATCNIRTSLNMQHTNMSRRVTSYSSYLRIAACMSNVPCKYAIGRGGMRECAGLRSAERGV